MIWENSFNWLVVPTIAFVTGFILLTIALLTLAFVVTKSALVLVVGMLLAIISILGKFYPMFFKNWIVKGCFVSLIIVGLVRIIAGDVLLESYFKFERSQAENQAISLDKESVNNKTYFIQKGTLLYDKGGSIIDVAKKDTKGLFLGKKKEGVGATLIKVMLPNASGDLVNGQEVFIPVTSPIKTKAEARTKARAKAEAELVQLKEQLAKAQADKARAEAEAKALAKARAKARAKVKAITPLHRQEQKGTPVEVITNLGDGWYKVRYPPPKDGRTLKFNFPVFVRNSDGNILGPRKVQWIKGGTNDGIMVLRTTMPIDKLKFI